MKQAYAKLSKLKILTSLSTNQYSEYLGPQRRLSDLRRSVGDMRV